MFWYDFFLLLSSMGFFLYAWKTIWATLGLFVCLIMLRWFQCNSRTCWFILRWNLKTGYFWDRRLKKNEEKKWAWILETGLNVFIYKSKHYLYISLPVSQAVISSVLKHDVWGTKVLAHCSCCHRISLRSRPLFDVSHQMAEYLIHCLCFLMELPTSKKVMTSVRLINRYHRYWTRTSMLLGSCTTLSVARM